MNTVSKMALTALATLYLTACDVGVQQELVPAADLVLVGGKIVTVDETNPEVEALAAKDGRIVALGDRSDLEAYIGEGTEVIDLAGALAVPGLIEGHGHFMGLGDSRIQLDLTGAAKAAAEAQPGEWIRGRGWLVACPATRHEQEATPPPARDTRRATRATP
jgi:predicted amidohydrolase YtcJ